MSENSLLQVVEQQDASATINLLEQAQLEGAVIIYDDSQEVVKLVTTVDSDNVESIKNCDNIDNLITLHASIDEKDRDIEENININTIPILDESKIEINLPIEEKVEPEETMQEEREEVYEKEEEEKEEDEEEVDDDETIATFVTSTGQQLALYAVENSDQVFAVALYDESGEPPTNFHFVMKDDVERLIEEGAVKTVKKKSAQPVQLKESLPIQKTDDLNFQITSELQSTSEVIQETSQNEEILPRPETPPRQEITLKQESPPKPSMSPVKQTTPSKSISTQKPVSPQKLASPQKSVSPQKPVSPQKLVSLQKPTSPQKSTSPQKLASPQKLSSLQKPASPQKLASPQKPAQKLVLPQKLVSPQKPTLPQNLTSLQKPVTSQILSFPQKPTLPQKPVTPLKPISPLKQYPLLLQKPVSSSKQVSLPKQTPPQKKEIFIKKVTEVTREIPEPKKVQVAHRPRMFLNKSKTAVDSSINVTKSQTPSIQSNKPRIVSNITNVQTTNEGEESIAYIVTEKNEAYLLERSQEEIDSDTEILEQSTVQYILGDVNSDEELTFDELERSLKNFNKSASKNKSIKKVEIPKPPPKPQQRTYVKFSSTVKSTPKLVPILTQRRSIKTTAMTTTATVTTTATKSTPTPAVILTPTPTAPRVIRTYSNPKKVVRPSTTQKFFQISSINVKKEVDQWMPDDHDTTFTDDSNIILESETDTSKKNSVIANTDRGGTENPVKVKRPRKQQLTAVNRPDCEIIIQQASVYSEEENEPIVIKRRGRRKKRLSPDPEYNPRKALRKTKRTSRAYEIIEIDVDDSERGSVLEVTLDGSIADSTNNKAKGSSDKENDDIISVRSSDDDSEEEEEEQQSSRKRDRRYNTKHNLPVQCNTCTRTFPTRRSLATHLHTCGKKPKAPANPKKFKCKTCYETFDAALTLARHVRMSHSPRKRSGRLAKGWVRDDKSETTTSDLYEEDDILSMSESSEPEVKPVRKKRGRPSKKRAIKEDSPSSDFSLKLESSNELESSKSDKQPATRSDSTKERSVSVEMEELNLTERRRRRGRPKKNISSNNETSLSPEFKKKTIIAQIPKKRDRFRRTYSKDDERSCSPEGEKMSDIENISETQKGSANPEEEEEEEKSTVNNKDDDAFKSEKTKVTDKNDDKPSAESDKEKVDQGEKDKISMEKNKQDKDTVSKDDEAESIDAIKDAIKDKSLEENPADTLDSERKQKSAIDNNSINSQTKDKSTKEENTMISESEETSSEANKRVLRSKIRRLSNNSDTSEPEEKSRTRSQSAKEKLLKDDNKSTPEDKSDTSETRTRSIRLAKDKLSKDEIVTSSEPEEKDNLMESRKRGRPAKDRSRKVNDKLESEASDIEEMKKSKLNDDKSAKIEEESLIEEIELDKSQEEEVDKEKKLAPNPGRSWKVKKLNCSDCGKWFSSAALLDTHRLQHRTKKTSKLVQRCQICKNFVPVEMFAKHMMTHKKVASMSSSSSTSLSTLSSSKPVLRQTTVAMQPKRLVRNVIFTGNVKRPNVRQLRSSN